MSSLTSSSTDPRRRRRHFLIRAITVVVAILLLVVLVLGWWWDYEPARFDVVESAQQRAVARGHQVVPGTVTTETLVRVAETLLDKRGGYLSNDMLPPGVWMDNVPNWEFGVLVQLRDLAKIYRNEFSRSQSQSAEDLDLAEADPLFSSPNDRWMLPSSEGQYRKAIGHVEQYLVRLSNSGRHDAQFYARADNLVDWLAVIEKRLGSLSQRLSASVGQVRLNTDLGRDQVQQSARDNTEELVKTPWLQIDDVFYEARGSSWAILHFLRAVEHDFAQVLRDKNATVSLRQIIRELEESQEPIWSPVVLNGSPYGLFANHSLVMANYISRANAAINDLRRLLERG